MIQPLGITMLPRPIAKPQRRTVTFAGDKTNQVSDSKLRQWMGSSALELLNIVADNQAKLKKPFQEMKKELKSQLTPPDPALYIIAPIVWLIGGPILLVKETKRMIQAKRSIREEMNLPVIEKLITDKLLESPPKTDKAYRELVDVLYVKPRHPLAKSKLVKEAMVFAGSQLQMNITDTINAIRKQAVPIKERETDQLQQMYISRWRQEPLQELVDKLLQLGTKSYPQVSSQTSGLSDRIRKQMELMEMVVLERVQANAEEKPQDADGLCHQICQSDYMAVASPEFQHAIQDLTLKLSKEADGARTQKAATETQTLKATR